MNNFTFYSPTFLLSEKIAKIKRENLLKDLAAQRF